MTRKGTAMRNKRMNKIWMNIVAGIFLAAGGCAAGPNVEFRKGEDRIDVLIEGRHFTTYLFQESLTKPILYPLLSPSGVKVNRSFPFVEVEGESRDHPHHTGLFFTYDRVNGEGFWNNTTSPPRIEHLEVTEMEGGRLCAILQWKGESDALLEEKREMVFSGGEDEFVVDFSITLSALQETVTFDDTKEGMFAIRVAHWLREKEGNGEYLSANGDRTAKSIWGKRAKWVALQGERDGKIFGIAILNHPGSVNYPTFWHARNYGLFSANPLGQYVFQKTRGEANPGHFRLTLKKGGSALFKFRVILFEGRRSKEELDARFKDYAG